MSSPTQWTWVWASSEREWRTGKSGVHGVAKSQTWLSDWTNKTDLKEVEIYELSEKEFRIILLSVLNYKNRETTKQNRGENVWTKWEAQQRNRNHKKKEKMKTDILYLKNTSNTPVFVCITAFLSIHLLMEEMNRQSRFDTGYRMLGASALGWPWGMVWGGRWERGSGLGTRVHPWQIHVDVWKNQYNIVK